LEEAFNSSTLKQNQATIKYSDPRKLQIPLLTERLNIKKARKKGLHLVRHWLKVKEGKSLLLSHFVNSNESIEEIFEYDDTVPGIICLKNKTLIGLIA